MMRQVSICSTSLSSKATSPGVLSTIKLGRPVCQVPLATIEVENPLTQTACLTTECKCRGIIVQLQPSVPGQSKVDNEYICHHIKKKNCVTLTGIMCVCLFFTGFFDCSLHASASRWVYCPSDFVQQWAGPLRLRALPPPPEQSVDFNTLLGSSHSVTVMFNNYSRFTTEYCSKVKSGKTIALSSLSVHLF